MSSDKKALPKVSDRGLHFETEPLVLLLGCNGCGEEATVALVASGAGGAPLCLECFATAVDEEARRTAKIWNEIASAAVEWVDGERDGLSAGAVAALLALLREHAGRFLDEIEARSRASLADKGPTS